MIADKYKGRVRVATVEVGPKSERLCRAYKVDRLPVMMVFKDGEPKDVIGGATDASNITGMLEMQLKPVVELSELNFNREVLRGSHPVLVHFWAAWCRQSLEMEQVIHDVAVKFQGRAKVARLEMRPDTMRLFARYDVARVPTTVVFQDGVVRDQILGAMTGGTQLGFGKAPLSWGGSVRREEAKRRATLSVVAKWERSEKARSTDPRPVLVVSRATRARSRCCCACSDRTISTPSRIGLPAPARGWGTGSRSKRARATTRRGTGGSS